MSLLQLLGLEPKTNCKHCGKFINLSKDNYNWTMSDELVCETCSTKIANYKKHLLKRKIKQLVAFK